MYNILLVDDEPIISEISIDILTIYLKQYSKEFSLHTATNGLEAVYICKNKNMDLIFMDVNMPVMNGIEATKEIKILSPKTMIIALSSLDDEEKQKEMFLAGAEDYVNKPISSVVFRSRLKNYLSIIDSRSHINFISSAVNLFSSKIYNHHLRFCVSNEDHLAEFWESVLIRMSFLKQVEHANDLVRLIYELGSLYLKKNIHFDILIEEDEENYYFTLTQADKILEKDINQLIEKNLPEVNSILDDTKLSFLLKKESIVEESVKQECITEVQAEVEYKQELTRVSSLEEDYSTYTFLQMDEVEEFEDSLYKLHGIVTVLGSNPCSSDEIELINSYFHEMKKALIQTSESYAIATAIEELSATISNNTKEFISMAKELQPIALGFVDDLISWKEMLFYTGAPSIDFMDDSIVANAKILQDLLAPQEVNEEALDDIFSF